MQDSQRGIALVEAVLAIVLLGILGVTALGHFDDLSDGTVAAVYNSVDARTSSAAAINYTARILDPSAMVAFNKGSGACLHGESVAALPSDYEDAGQGGTAPGISCR